MNETAASIAGDEIRRIVMERYYPEFAWRHWQAGQAGRAGVDAHLQLRFPLKCTKRGCAPMNCWRRAKSKKPKPTWKRAGKSFGRTGYPIRKLNQAYFAFHGAYADTPGGAAGEGRWASRARAAAPAAPTLREFLERIGGMSSVRGIALPPCEMGSLIVV